MCIASAPSTPAPPPVVIPRKPPQPVDQAVLDARRRAKDVSTRGGLAATDITQGALAAPAGGQSAPGLFQGAGPTSGSLLG